MTLSVYGTVSTGLDLQGVQKIICRGFVADIDQIYEEADVIINPVRFGAGLKIKNVEALSHGVPLVTTAHGARGIEDGINNAFLVADTADEFIKSIETLIGNAKLRTTFSQNSVRYIKENFSAEECFRPLLKVLG